MFLTIPIRSISLVARLLQRRFARTAATMSIFAMVVIPRAAEWLPPRPNDVPSSQRQVRGGAVPQVPAVMIANRSTGALRRPQPGFEEIRGCPSGPDRASSIRLCQFAAASGDKRADPTAPRARDGAGLSPVPHSVVAGLDSANQCCEPGWNQRQCIPWSPYGPGEYAGPARTIPLAEYRIRPRDVLEFVYRLTRERSSAPYKLEVGDIVNVEFLRDESLSRELTIQPDGMIILPYVGSVLAADRTAEQLQKTLIERFEDFYKTPLIVVTPTKVSTRLEDLRAAIDRRFGRGGQAFVTTVTPEGTIQLPGIGSVRVQGLNLTELKWEIDERYDTIVGGIEVSPVLVERAPTFVYVLGEVRTPGRFNLDSPTTAMQAIALSGGWNVGANLRQIVVFRRAEDWRLVATMLDLRGAVYGKRPLPADEIWLRDSDIVLVPKAPIKVLDDAVNLVFTEGFYRILPSASLGWGFREYRLL